MRDWLMGVRTFPAVLVMTSVVFYGSFFSMAFFS